MDDIREELEQNFASAETQREGVGNVTEEQPQVQEPAVTDEWIDAPKSYTKEYQENFKTLSPEWRKYLIEREKQVEKGFSDLGNRANANNWVNDVYSARQGRLSKNGINRAQDYFELLANIDDALAKDPKQAIRILAESYGVTQNENNSPLSDLQHEVLAIRQAMQNQQAFLVEQQKQQANKVFNDFVNEKDDAGNLKHPYLKEVSQIMHDLIKGGVCSTLPDAYERAVWLNEDVRNKMIADKSKAELNARVADANKAKVVGFAPSSKAEEPVKERTLREELEDAFNKVG